MRQAEQLVLDLIVLVVGFANLKSSNGFVRNGRSRVWILLTARACFVSAGQNERGTTENGTVVGLDVQQESWRHLEFLLTDS